MTTSGKWYVEMTQDGETVYLDRQVTLSAGTTYEMGWDAERYVVREAGRDNSETESRESVAGEVLPPEDAFTALVIVLRDKMEHLDPTDRWDTKWEDLTPRERSFYETLLRFLLAHDKLIEAAMRQLHEDR